MNDVFRMPLDDIKVGDRWRRHTTPLPPPRSGMPPLLVSPEGQLLSGWLRLRSAREYGLPDVPVRTVATLAEFVPLFLGEDPAASPMRFSDLMRLMDTLVALEMPHINRRRLNCLRANRGGERGPQLSPLRLRDALSAVGGFSVSTVGRARPVWDALKDGKHPQAELLDDLDAGKATITAAYHLLFVPDPRQSPTVDAMVGAVKRHKLPPPTLEETPHLRKQAQVIANTVHGLAGYTVALKPLDPRAALLLPTGDVATVRHDLVEFLRALQPILNTLKEHS